MATRMRVRVEIKVALADLAGVLAYLLPAAWQPEGLVQMLGTDYKFAVSFIILVIVLLVRPTGIFRGQEL